MTSLPDLLPLEDFNGDWEAYVEELHCIFIREIARAGILFRNREVSCLRRPETEGRWKSFWHLIQKGSIEDERTPDFRRCERLRWVPWVINNAGVHPEIDEWSNKRKRETNTLLWYREEYLVVLSHKVVPSQKKDFWLLKTAYPIEEEHTIRKLRKERDGFYRVSGKVKKS